MIIAATRGNPQASEIAVQTALPMVGSGSREDLQATLNLVDSEIAKLFEDRNVLLTGGGLIKNNSLSTSVTLTANLYLHINSQVAGGAPTVIDLTAGPLSFTASGAMAYVIIDRLLGTATLFDDATTLPAVTAANQEVYLIAKRDGTTVYFRNGFAIAATHTDSFATTGSFLDNQFEVKDATDETIKVKLDAAGSTGTTTTLQSSQTTNQTLILPDITDTLITKTSTDTLTNKTLAFLRQNVLTDNTTTGTATTLSPAPIDGVIRLTNAGLISLAGITAGLSGQTLILENVLGNSIEILNDDAAASVGTRIYTGTENGVTLNNNASFIFNYDSINQHWMLTGGSGSGSGTGNINFIENGNAEASANPFESYLSSIVGSRPEGTQTIQVSSPLTATRSLVTPLAGDAHWLISKTAVNAQGYNLSLPFIVEPAYKAKSVKIKMDYIVVSGTFVAGSNIGTVQDSDLIAYIYNVDTGEYIEPTNFRFLSNNTAIADHFEAEFQTHATSTNYRLLFHAATTSALAYSLAFDNIAVSPNEYVFGNPVTKEYPISLSPQGFGATNGSYQASRTGDRLKVRGFFRVGAPQATLASIVLDGLTIDTSGQTITATQPFGSWVRGIDATPSQMANNAIGPRMMFVKNTVPNTIYFAAITNAVGGASPTSMFQDVSANAIVAANDQIAFEFEVPILGWASSVQTSDQTSTRVVAARYSIPSGVSTTSGTPFNFITQHFDSHAAVTPGVGTWKYTAPISGIYRVTAKLYYNGNASIAVYKNGIKDVSLGQSYASGNTAGIPGSVTIQLVAGDYIDIRSPDTTFTPSNAGFPALTVADLNYVMVDRLSGPSVIAAAETVAASYYASANVSTTANNPINFDTKEFDTHGAVTTGIGTWKFTAPVSGVYCIGGYLRSAIVSVGANIIVFKNGVSYKFSGLINDNGGASVSINTPSVVLKLNAGDFIDLRPSINSTFGGGSAPIQASISIHKISGVN